MPRPSRPCCPCKLVFLPHLPSAGTPEESKNLAPGRTATEGRPRQKSSDPGKASPQAGRFRRPAGIVGGRERAATQNYAPKVSPRTKLQNTSAASAGTPKSKNFAFAGFAELTSSAEELSKFCKYVP